MRAPRTLFILLFLLTLFTGCGPRPVTGGTPGTLRAGGELLSDIQVNVFQLEGGTWKPIGFGLTGLQGEFALFTPGAQGPLTLIPGNYRFTVESAGAPIFFPPEYAQAETTPLTITWPTSTSLLTLDVPLVLTQ